MGYWPIGTGTYSLPSTKIYTSGSIFTEYPLEPEPYPVQSNDCGQVGGFILHSPENFQCWYIPLPCAHWYAGAIELRGDDLNDGFRIPDRK
jgi:hypothetical protein